jgi:putative membrane protein
MTILISLVALFHIYVFAMESLLWKTAFARKAFGTSLKTAEITYTLAVNQGVYNLFLAAGLIWSLLTGDPELARQLQIFFLGCVVLAAVTAGLVISKRIMFIQGGPALLALILVIAR